MVGKIDEIKYDGYEDYGHFKLLGRTKKITWLLKFRWLQFIKLMTNTSVLPSIILGIITISITIALQRNSAGTNIATMNPWLFWSLFSVINLIALVGVSIVGGRYLFINQPPHIYAEYTISGTNPSDSMIYISYCIWRECCFVRKHVGLFKKFEELTLAGGDPNRVKCSQADMDDVEDFIKGFHKRFHKVKKIDYMMIELAKDMGIPPHRLSDSLFQFSPEIYLYETRITLETMQETISLLSDYQKDVKKDKGEKVFNKNDDSEVLKDRSFDRSKRINRYWKAIYVRRDFQESIMEFDNVHQSIIDMSMDFGISSSLSAYCFGIQNCFSSSNGDVSLDTKARQLAFLYHKRRMCPGYDLHAILHNFIGMKFPDYYEVCEDFGNVDATKFGTLLKVAERILFDFEKEKRKQRVLIEERFEKFIEHTLKTRISKKKSLQTEQKKLEEEIRDIEGSESDELTKGLAQKHGLKELKKRMAEINDVQNIVFVTKGFSSVVTSTLHSFAKEIRNKRWKSIFSELKVYVYIIYEPEELKNHATDIRYMRYKYMENPNVQRRSEDNIHVKIGEVDWWKNQFGNRKSINFFLSGAEFVQVRDSGSAINAERNDISHSHMGNDFQKIECQLMNDEGVVNLLDDSDVQEKLGDQLTHVVLAEDYKFFKQKLHRKAENAFNRAYSENQKLYPYAERIAITGADQV